MMIANATPDAIRDRAMGLIALRLQRRPSPDERLASLGVVATADVLIDLERAFHICLDVDDALPGGRIADLLEVTERRARLSLILRHRWSERFDDDGSAKACRIFDLAVARARRARGEPLGAGEAIGSVA